MISPRIAISCSAAKKIPEAMQLAEQLQLAFIDEQHVVTSDEYDYLLLFTPAYLGLLQKNHKKPFYIDFLSGKLQFRNKQARLRQEALAKAISLKPQQHPIVIDATAGLGRDSFILATLGYHVIMLERSSIIHALLRDAIHRAKNATETHTIVQKLHLIHTDGISWLSKLGHQNALVPPHVIYLDPMFPERKKSASSKKEMKILQDLLGPDHDSATLFELAIACATHRVVVKRPRLAANIVPHPPSKLFN